ncbi:MAG: hypothetical protein LBE20_02535 [Deltaproteobacteria bacterium]|jgi:hypothetical protein|nr:hypothetical protein [Deltaproteobacteria bacterium]
MWKRIIISIALTLVLLGVTINLNLWVKKQEVVTASFNAKGVGVIEWQVFYTEDPKENFNEKQSVRKKVDLSKTSYVSIDIPSKKINQFRLDFGTIPKTVEISNLVLSGMQKHYLKNFSDLKYNQIDKYEALPSAGLRIISEQTDPYIVFGVVDVEGKQPIDVKVFAIVILLSLLVFYKLTGYIIKPTLLS